MVYFQGLFVSQTHKTRSAYYLNHDVLMAVNPEARKRLIFYFIAQQIPEKLDESDRAKYYTDRIGSLTAPILAFSGLGIAAFYKMSTVPLKVFRKNIAFQTLKILGAVCFGGALTNSIGWRIFEARLISQSQLIENLSNKYDFSIYDFAIAKKESHVKKLLEIMDAHHDTLHQE